MYEANKAENLKILGHVSKALDIISSNKKETGSVVGRGAIASNSKVGFQCLTCDYFDDNAAFKARFRHRFKMRKELFLRITEALEDYDQYFVQKINAKENLRLAALQKTPATI